MGPEQATACSCSLSRLKVPLCMMCVIVCARMRACVCVWGGGMKPGRVGLRVCV